MEIRACVCLSKTAKTSYRQQDSQVNNCSMCPPWTLTTVFNLGRTDQWLCWSVVDRDWPSRYALSLRSSKPTIGTLYTSCCRAPQTAYSTGFMFELFGGQIEGSMKLGTFCCRNSTVNFTACPIVFPVELGCFHFFYPITNYCKYLHEICTCYSELIIFRRALFTLNVHYSWKT